MTRSGNRLARMLALVPYLQQNPGIETAEAARVFGVTERQLRDDLDLLFFCGLPGYTPGDLIEVSYEGDRITVRNADTMGRPLRLTPEEALALVVAARALAAEPGLVERDALDRALAKLEAAFGSVESRVEVSLDAAGETLALAERAVEAKRRLRIRYHNPSRDEVTDRDVDPMRVVNVEGRWYLEAWCRRVEDVRLFRLDRVIEATELDVAAEVPARAASKRLSEGLYEPAPEDPEVVLDLDREARWVADYHPYESVEERDGGGVRLTLRVHDDGWLRRLLLRLGPHARVVSPVTLGEAVRETATAALAAYGGHSA